MENRVISYESAKNILIVVLGCIIIILCGWIKIPFYPVCFTLHTLAIYIIGLTQSPKMALTSVFCYLLIGQDNLPWVLGKASGYILSFPVAVYCIAKVREKRTPFESLLCGSAIIFAGGFLGLLPFVGWQTAFIRGVVVFIPSTFLKMSASLYLTTWRNR